jgi:hypothetical protein
MDIKIVCGYEYFTLPEEFYTMVKTEMVAREEVKDLDKANTVLGHHLNIGRRNGKKKILVCSCLYVET